MERPQAAKRALWHSQIADQCTSPHLLQKTGKIKPPKTAQNKGVKPKMV
jgi:hypothetical protein